MVVLFILETQHKGSRVNDLLLTTLFYAVMTSPTNIDGTLLKDF